MIRKESATDVRIVAKSINDSRITKEEYQKYLDSLEDCSYNAVDLVLDEVTESEVPTIDDFNS